MRTLCLRALSIAALCAAPTVLACGDDAAGSGGSAAAGAAGGGGGAGGQGGAPGGGGAGGGPCATPLECPGNDNDCRTRTCEGGACGFAYAAAGEPLSTQEDGDCQRLVCDGAGSATPEADDLDLPLDDMNPCTGEACNAGTPEHPPLAAGTVCGQGMVCDGMGTCVTP